MIRATAQTPAPIESVPVHGQVSLLGTVDGTNVAVQVGAQGVLVVDTSTEAMGDALVSAIRTLAGNKPIRYVINTSADLDHVGGNQKVAASGAQLVGGNFDAQLGAAGAQSTLIWLVNPQRAGSSTFADYMREWAAGFQQRGGAQARLPGARAAACEQAALADGLRIPEAVARELESVARGLDLPLPWH